jgi:hypothetical protein
MSTDAELLVLDRIEDGVAILVTDNGETIEVARSVLPVGAREGHVLSVPRDAGGGLRWGAAAVDDEATAKRLAEADDVLGELRKRDPGGDVLL